MNEVKSKLFRTCPKTGRIVGVKRPEGWLNFLFPLVGLVALLWFVARVVPKPSRAAYPCQQVAMPLASGFVLWLAGITGSAVALRRAHRDFRHGRWLTSALAVIVAVVGVGWAIVSQHQTTQASTLPARVAYDPHPANDPIGTAKGLMPGRVVWVHNPAVTNWAGPGDSTLWYNAIDQGAANTMVSQSLRSYANAATDTAAWDAIFRGFNGGSVGYQPGEKIYIKINLTTSNYGSDGSGCADTNDEQKYHPSCWGIFNYSIGPSPQLMHALLDQLVNVVGVAQADITIGDSTGVFVNHLYNPLHNDFPNVKYMDKRGTLGRTLATLSTTPLYWSTTEANSKTQDYLLAAANAAKYNIDLAILKTHDRNGITLTAKNHFGSMYRTPTTTGYYDLHGRLPMQGTWGQAGSLGQYRPLVDLNGHAGMGGKTVLYLLDGIYGGWSWLAAPTKWNEAPFNDDWPSSFFLSMDQVAIDSVGFDLLSEQWPEHALANEGVQDYLHEMALANNPPSGTFYDPERDGTRLASMGVHEHWNNPVEKEYTRNLGTGDGIELVYVPNAAPPAPVVCGSQSILFVTSTTSPVPAADQAVISHLTAAGYTVTTKGQSSAVTADALDKDLVIISETVDSNTVGVKYRDIAVPVIVWESGLFDDMQMTSTTSGTHFGSTSSQTQVNVVNSTHPLAAGLSGLVTTTSANKTYSWGVPASGADIIATLASNSGRATVFAYETGRPMFPGTTTDKSGVVTPAPARRVGFFTGDSLSSDGWKLFDAAVTWSVKCSAAGSLTLVNGDTGEDIGPVTDGGRISLADVPTHNLNIRASVDPAIVGSVGFSYDGNVTYRTDNTAPYTLDGSAAGEASPKWTPTVGQHTLVVIPYSSVNRGGRAGAPLTVNFEVVEQPLGIILADFSAEEGPDSIQIRWETVTEINVMGFNLYRGTTSATPGPLIASIPASGPGGPAGAWYEYRDSSVTAGEIYWYWLEVNTIDGTPVWGGPIRATYQVPGGVVLADFGAQEAPDGIRVLWETVTEINVMGFNLYRDTTSATPGPLIASISASGPGGPAGAWYEYLDTNVTAGETYWYWLEVITIDGTPVWGGPVSAGYQVPTALRLADLHANEGRATPDLWWMVIGATAGVGILVLRRRQRRISH